MQSVFRRLAIFLVVLPVAAHAIVVRGTVTNPYGVPISNARVELLRGTAVVAFTYAGHDGSFEIRSAARGRFRLLTLASPFATGIGQDLYGKPTDVVTRNVVLEAATYTAPLTVTATLIPIPSEQAAAPITLTDAFHLSTRTDLLDRLRQIPGVAIVQQGRAGSAASLYVRGGSGIANRVLFDGIPSNGVGGAFDWGTLTTTAIDQMELYRGADSVLYGTGPTASVVAFTTPSGGSPHPFLTYSGDVGGFHSYRNQAALSGSHQRWDYYTAFGRFDTSNGLPLDNFHGATSAANVGYALSANTQARLLLHDDVSVTGLPGAHDFYGISNDARQANQNLYASFTLEDHVLDQRLHNLLRYDIARRRAQESQYAYPGTLLSVAGSPAYFGDAVTIHGANGYTANGRASFLAPSDPLPPNSEADSNRDELQFQSDYVVNTHFAALFGFRYEDERGSLVDATEAATTQRTNFEYTLQLQGGFRNRVFYSAGGAIEKNHLFGVTGTPRLGLAYDAVRTTPRKFRGTRLRATVATGVAEPSLPLQFLSLYNQLLLHGDAASLAADHISQLTAERSRTYDLGVDQNILGERLAFSLGYFHNVFDHQVEPVDAAGLEHDFGLPVVLAQQTPLAYLNGLAWRAQGIESQLHWQALKHLAVQTGYTWLDSLVLQSFAPDAVNLQLGTPTTNPDLPGIPIGATSPLVGARMFRRPPNTGFVSAEYVNHSFAAALQGAFSGRSDDSTFLGGYDTAGGNSLLLPNRDLDHGYARLDANLSFVATHHITFFTQLDNLLSEQHIAPIGYPSLPFTLRLGLKYRLGGD